MKLHTVDARTGTVGPGLNPEVSRERVARSGSVPLRANDWQAGE